LSFDDYFSMTVAMAVRSTSGSAGGWAQTGSEYEFEISAVAAVVIAEKDAKLRIGRIGVHVESVKVVGDIERRDGETHAVFRGNFKIPYYARIRGKEIGVPGTVRNSEVVLAFVETDIGESISVFNDGQYLQFEMRKVKAAPSKETVGQVGGEV
jgi:hypothetical protein